MASRRPDRFLGRGPIEATQAAGDHHGLASLQLPLNLVHEMGIKRRPFGQ